jgi:hypothetical protein
VRHAIVCGPLNCSLRWHLPLALQVKLCRNSRENRVISTRRCQELDQRLHFLERAGCGDVVRDEDAVLAPVQRLRGVEDRRCAM